MTTHNQPPPPLPSSTLPSPPSQPHRHAQSQPQDPDSPIFRQLTTYPWSTDTDFQSGLRAILGSDPPPSPSQEEHLTLRAQCFYFSRKNDIPIDFDAYQTWRSRHSSEKFSAFADHTAAVSSHPRSVHPVSESASIPHAFQAEQSIAASSDEPPAPYPTSFSQIVELITNGQPIPGIRAVPDTVLEGHASRPTTTKRRKPWEKDDAEEKKASCTNAQIMT